MVGGCPEVGAGCPGSPPMGVQYPPPLTGVAPDTGGVRRHGRIKYYLQGKEG